ncbi:MAG: NAD-binding protein [Victivallales bacterium]|nr:NAD-binding protein [Victivallales bacterium]
MKIIIIGVGELGQLLATRLSEAEHDVVIIDTEVDEFEHVRDKLDVMTLVGDANSISVMKRAGIDTADMLVAVSGNQAVNMLACQLASHLGVKRSICRLYSTDVFSEEDGITPGFFGIGKSFSSPAECAKLVMDVLRHQVVLEQMEFSNKDATMVTVQVPNESPLRGERIQSIPDVELRDNIRFAALVRDNQLKYPHGDTQFLAGDRYYVAGRRDYIDRFLESLAPEKDHPLVVIGGATLLASVVAKDALVSGMTVRIIEPDKLHADKFLDIMPPEVKVIVGSSTDEDILREAGADRCDVYVNTELNDENTILSCIIAKRMGASKVVAITHKTEYISIVPELNVIDCAFNSTQVSVNTVFRLMNEGVLRVDSRLESYRAYLTEFRIQEKSRLIGKEIREAKLPKDAILVMVFRGNEVIAPTGLTKLQKDDVVVAIVTLETEELLKPYFVS